MGLTDAADEPGLPEGPELEAARKAIQEEAAEIEARFEARLGDRRANEPATLRDLLELNHIAWARMVAFTTLHTRRRCVMRNEVLLSDAGVKALAPLWKGIWSRGSAHGQGSLVAHKHGLWVAEQATVQEPGTPDSGWRLAIKRPR